MNRADKPAVTKQRKRAQDRCAQLELELSAISDWMAEADHEHYLDTKAFANARTFVDSAWRSVRFAAQCLTAE